MADPVAVAIKQEAATRALNETLLRLEEKIDRALAVSATPPAPAAAKGEVLAAFAAKAPTNTGPVEPARPKGK